MQILHSDQGGQFESAVITEVCNKFGILKTRTTGYYPASDGQVERLNRTLIEMLSKYAGQTQRRWDEHLPLVLLAYRSSVHDSTSVAGHDDVSQGTRLDLPVDLILESPEYLSKQSKEPTKYVTNLSANMKGSTT